MDADAFRTDRLINFESMEIPSNSDGLDEVVEDCKGVPDNKYVLGCLRDSGSWCKIHCRISSGRDANVYYATDRNGRELAIKVFTILDRDLTFRFDFPAEHYETGDISFPDRCGMEFMALTHMENTGIKCPTPVTFYRHVLIEGFIGKLGVPAPTLSDVQLQLSEVQLFESYKEMIRIMRTLYQKCDLVHGDLSETNVLYHEGHLYVIDASQSLVKGHRYARKLLKKDCSRVVEFFGRYVTPIVTAYQLFCIVIDWSMTNESFDNYLKEIVQNTRAEKKRKRRSEDDLIPGHNVSTTQVKEEMGGVEGNAGRETKVAHEKNIKP